MYQTRIAHAGSEVRPQSRDTRRTPPSAGKGSGMRFTHFKDFDD